MSTTRRTRSSSLHARTIEALRRGPSHLGGLRAAEPADERDLLMTVLTVHDLHVAPVASLAGAERWQHHPAIADLKWRLDDHLVSALDRADAARDLDLPDDPVAALRSLAALDLTPPVYDWLADEATMEETVEFLSLEGGPDGGFDDLVALCQVGLDGRPKLELARNYWDEMGNGTLADVHTELHRRLTAALGLAAVPRARQPVEALARAAVGSLLATNRVLQPEVIGALGLIELQAGPRCRRVVAALRRLDAPEDAFPFYEEHARVDPKHGKAWLDEVIAPLAGDPAMAAGMVRGARWRSLVNERFFAAMQRRFTGAAVESGQPLWRPAQAALRAGA